jgi:uncharacterized membrane protein YphA (DoxX/SURF4 family)
MKNVTVCLFTFLRILVGWHFLYEGVAKLYASNWSAESYLTSSQWVFSDVFQAMASSPAVLRFVDFINIYGLIIIGLSLFLGLFVRWTSLAGALLLLFYFVAHPPIPGYDYFSSQEGSYLLVNKTFIEFFLLIVFAIIPRNLLYGADRLIAVWRSEKAHPPIPSSQSQKSYSPQRRQLLRNLIGVPFMGAFAYALYKKRQWEALEKNVLPENPDATTGPTISFTNTALEELRGQVPKGKIKDIDFSRLIMGGNLIGGWAHARDLLYVDRLVKEYHSEERIIHTLNLAQKCGINAIISNPRQLEVVNKYHHVVKDADIRFISDCQYGSGFIDGIKISLKGNADALYCGGSFAEMLLEKGDLDQIAEGIELIRKAGKPAGIGAHRIETVKACVERGIKPDFWVKTLHHHNYWSAQPEKPHDSMYCFDPKGTIEYMHDLKEPWIAFKVLAAGAIHPSKAFQYAYENGGDFICVGMYDFQIVEDVNIMHDALASINGRTRPWRG